MSNMETFTSAAMNVYLDGLAPTSKIAYVNKMTSFIEIERFQASKSSSSVTKRNRTVCSSSSSAANDNVWSLMPTISIGAGSSNNQIHVNIGYPPSTVISGSSIADEESKE